MLTIWLKKVRSQDLGILHVDWPSHMTWYLCCMLRPLFWALVEEILEHPAWYQISDLLKTPQIKNSRYDAKFRAPDPWRVSDFGTLPIESSSCIVLNLGFYIHGGSYNPPGLEPNNSDGNEFESSDCCSLMLHTKWHSKWGKSFLKSIIGFSADSKIRLQNQLNALQKLHQGSRLSLSTSLLVSNTNHAKV